MTETLTTGTPPPQAGSGYQPTLDGLRPGTTQQTVELHLDNLPRRWPREDPR